MNITTWSKTLLSLYPKLSKLISALDKNIDRLITASSRSCNDALSDVDKIRVIIKQKKELELIAQITRKAMSCIDDRIVLAYKYFHYLTYNEIAIKLNTYIKAAFRMHNKQLAKFGSIISDMGYTAEGCREIWGDNAIVMKEYSNYNKEDSDMCDKCYVVYNVTGDEVESTEKEALHIFNPYLTAFM